GGWGWMGRVRWMLDAANGGRGDARRASGTDPSGSVRPWEIDQSRRCRCSRNVGGPDPVGRTSVPRARIGFGWTATASGAVVGPIGAAVCDADATAGPLVTAVTPQQLRADGSDSGSRQCPQQLSARSSAASTLGFA